MPDRDLAGSCTPASDGTAAPEAGDDAKRRREQNIKAMLSDTMEVERQAMLPTYLKARAAEWLRVWVCLDACIRGRAVVGENCRLSGFA